MGTIVGGSPVGGILSYTMTGDEEITDCHVDAKITALNTVGGIIGSDKRSLVERCYVEGEIEATDGGRFSHGPKAGGIVGELMANYDGQGNAVSIKNCYVALSELKGFETAGTPEYARSIPPSTASQAGRRTTASPSPAATTIRTIHLRTWCHRRRGDRL